ncbi:MAG TPA: hypothetical protein VK762_02880 [Polyangiaceae bacterium]|nr:hypothetical protein [Polyangiaceae bacterium]
MVFAAAWAIAAGCGGTVANGKADSVVPGGGDDSNATAAATEAGSDGSASVDGPGDANAEARYELGVGEVTGALGVSVNLPDNARAIDTLNFAITGPDGASTIVQVGSVNAGQSLSLSFVVGRIPPGSNYMIAFTGASSDGTVTCSGSATFSIEPRTTTSVTDTLQCTSGTAGGPQGDAGPPYACAAWTSVAANPAETTVGSSVMLMASATGPNPNDLAYAWSAPSGEFSSPSASSTSFTCTASGTVVVKLVVSDGPVPAGQSCASALDTTTIVLTCDSPLDASTGG